MTGVNDLIKTEWKCSVPVIISTEKYAELYRKAEAIDAIRAEIDEKTEIHPDGEFYIKNIDVKRIIDRHINGNLAESSRGEVVEAVVGSLLPGLAEALTSLPVGTKCKVYIPWQKAYGTRGSKKVPPYSALVYDIELVRIVTK